MNTTRHSLLRSAIAGATALFAICGASAQQADNPVSYPISFAADLFLAQPPIGNGATAEIQVTIVDADGNTRTAQCTNSTGNTTVPSPTITAMILPNKEYSVGLFMKVIAGSAGGTAQGTARFVPPTGFSLLIDGKNSIVTKRTLSGSGTVFLNTAFKVRIGVATDYQQLDPYVDLPGGAATSITADKPIWYVGLGKMRNGQTAGGIGFRRQDFNAVNGVGFFTPAALYYDSPDQAEVDRVPSAGVIRQIRSREVLVDVPTQPLGATSYSINVYPVDAITGNNPDGTYNFTGTPICAYTISQINDADGNGVKILRIEDGDSTNKSFETSLQLFQDSSGANWTFRDWRRSGIVGLGINKVKSVFPNALNATVSHSGAATDANPTDLGNTANLETPFTWQKTFVQQDWGKEVSQVTLGSQTAVPLITSYTYHTNTAGVGYKGMVRSKVNPDGSWLRYDYYATASGAGAAGMVQRVYKPWLDGPVSPESSSTANSVYEDWTYGPDGDGSYTLPATHTVSAPGGTVLAKSVWAYTTNSSPDVNGMGVSKWDRKDYFGAGPNDCLTTTTRYYQRDLAEKYYREKPVSIQHPDGRKESFVYLNGDWNESSRTFTPNGAGAARAIRKLNGQTSGGVQVDSWEGPTDALQMVPNYSTISETITDTKGRVVCRAEYVFLAAGSSEPISKMLFRYDVHGRLTETVDLIRSVGSAEYKQVNTYAAGLLQSSVSADGIITNYTYDALLRRYKTIEGVNGPSGYPAKTHEVRFDGAGRTRKRISPTNTRVITYDPAGRVDSEADVAPNGSDLTTDYRYDSLQQTSTYYPSLAYKTEHRYRDGRLKSVDGTAVTPAYYDYAANASGLKVTQKNGATTSNGWTEQQFDWLGRKLKESTPTWGWPTASNNILDVEYEYYPPTAATGAGLLYRERTKNRATGGYLLTGKIRTYTADGSVLWIGTDNNNDSALSAASTDRIREVGRQYEKDAWGWREITTERVYGTANSSASTEVSRVIERLTGFNAGALSSGDFVVGDVVRFDAAGRNSGAWDFSDPASKMRYSLSWVQGASNYAYSESINGYGSDERSASGVDVAREYDSRGRLRYVRNRWNGSAYTTATAYSYYGNTAFVNTVREGCTVGAGGAVSADGVLTTTAYAWFTNGTTRIITTDGAGNSTGRLYDGRQNLIRTWGAGGQPVLYEYDGLGRMTSSTTWRQPTLDASGWPTNPGDVTTWTYDPGSGKLTDQTYANGGKTSFTYTPLGQVHTRTTARGIVTTYGYDPLTGELTGKTYSDGTQPVGFTYNRLGALATVSDAAGTRTLNYRSDLKLANETFDSTFYGSRVLTSNYDATVPGRRAGFSFNGNVTLSAAWSFDGATGRLNSIRGDLGSHNVTFALGYAPGTDWVNSITSGSFSRSQPLHARLDAPASVGTTWGTTQLTRFAAHYGDPRGWIDRQDSGTANAAASSWSKLLGLGDGLSSPFAYSTDGSLNSAATPTWLGAAGTESLANRNFGWTYDRAGNRTTESGVNTGTYTPNLLNRYSSITGSLAESPITYDASSNLTGLSSATMTYDGEDRLKTYTDSSRTITYTYDYLGRTIRRVGSNNGGDTKFLWYGWNRVGELAADGVTVQREFLWGSDFSSNGRAAGGAGGLLAQLNSGTGVFYAAPDIFGNVAAYINTSGTIAAAREFSPFGRVVRAYYASGFSSANFPHAFSSKYLDAQSGWYDYGLRYYMPKHGRFVNRDPIGEAGGNNLYAFASNNPTNRWDLLGLTDTAHSSDWAWVLYSQSAIWRYYMQTAMFTPSSSSNNMPPPARASKSTLVRILASTQAAEFDGEGMVPAANSAMLAGTMVITSEQILAAGEGLGARAVLRVGMQVLVAVGEGAVVPVTITAITTHGIVVSITGPVIFAPVTSNNPVIRVLRNPYGTTRNPGIGSGADSMDGSGDVVFPSAEELGRRLRVPRKVFEREKKKEIIGDHKPESEKIGSTNPDIGIDGDGNIVLRHPEKKHRTIGTGTPLEGYAEPEIPNPEVPNPEPPTPNPP